MTQPHFIGTVKIVTRSDFIGLYVGSSTRKTKNLLDCNKGNTLLIDETNEYLIIDKQDSYGKEAFDTIYSYMESNGNDIKIIFINYNH